MYEYTVTSGTRHSTGSQNVEGHWLQLVHCTYPLVVSLYFVYMLQLWLHCHSTGNSGQVGSGRYWTLASARALRLPSIAVQVFRTYLRSSGPRKHGTRELRSRVR